MSRVGIIDVKNDEVKVIGFGVLSGTETIYDDELGLDISVTKVLLDAGTIYVVKDSFIDSEESILKEISIYKGKGYKIL